MKPSVRESPLRVEIDFAFPLKPQLMASVPGIERRGNTISCTGPGILDVLARLELILLATDHMPIWRQPIAVGVGRLCQKRILQHRVWDAWAAT
jgi:hypothetical protein